MRKREPFCMAALSWLGAACSAASPPRQDVLARKRPVAPENLIQHGSYGFI
jgi:hypothetical protein